MPSVARPLVRNNVVQYEVIHGGSAQQAEDAWLVWKWACQEGRADRVWTLTEACVPSRDRRGRLFMSMKLL